MTRAELLQIAKPILFNTDMVRAFLDGRKTVTRRLVKQGKKSTPEYHGRDKFYGIVDHLNNDYKHRYAGFYNVNDVFYVDGKEHIDAIYFKAQYKLGDILYVRETWSDHYEPDEKGKPKLEYCYKADGIDIKAECLPGENNRWYPSIHMPKEAARIFLKVKDVRVERLQDMNEVDTAKEGIRTDIQTHRLDDPDFIENFGGIDKFKALWNSTIKKTDLAKYGWDANPWVWVIEFERIEPGKE